MALANSCVNSGAKVTMIIGSISTQIEKRAKAIFVTSADDMYEAVMDNIENQDLFISCAAVADFKPAKVSQNKIKKNTNLESIILSKNKDILESVCKLNIKPICIGFAAETENLIANATEKLINKKCDAIVVNDVSNREFGLNSNNNEVHFITSKKTEKINKNSKQIIAEKLINKIVKYFF